MVDSPAILGLDFGGTKIAVAVGDLSGARLGAATVQTRAGADAEETMDRSLDAARRLLASAAPDRDLVGVGAATLGIPHDDRVELVPTFPEWGSVAFGRRVRAAFPGIPVRLGTDVKAAATAELRWGALAGCNPGIYLNLGTGLAVAVVARGAIISGAHGAAGEIGYNLRSPDDVWTSDGERTMLEDLVSGKALADAGTEMLGRPVSAADVFTLARGDARVADLVDRFVRELAMHLVNLTIAVDPTRIVVGGGMVGSWTQIAPGLRRALDAAVPFPPELTTARFPFDAPLIGALALGADAAGAVGEEEAALA